MCFLVQPAAPTDFIPLPRAGHGGRYIVVYYGLFNLFSADSWQHPTAASISYPGHQLVSDEDTLAFTDPRGPTPAHHAGCRPGLAGTSFPAVKEGENRGRWSFPRPCVERRHDDFCQASSTDGFFTTRQLTTCVQWFVTSPVAGCREASATPSMNLGMTSGRPWASASRRRRRLPEQCREKKDKPDLRQPHLRSSR